MDFSSGLALKILGGLGVLSVGSTGIYFANDYFQSSLTRFDKAIIDYLNTNGQDIVFTVTGADDTNFPTFTGTEKVKVAAKITVATSTTTSFKGTNSTEKIKELKKLNKNNSNNEGKDWNWECVIEFDKTGKTNTALEENIKNKLVQTTSQKGFFDQLKENTTDSTSRTDEEKAQIKKIKENFIRNCALARTRKKNKEISGKDTLGDDDLKATKTFKLMDGNANDKHGRTTTGKLYFENLEEFKSWFQIN